MLKRLLTITAGIIIIPAFFYASEPGQGAFSDRLTTPLLAQISMAPWIEARGYFDMPELRRFRVMAQDLAFDHWLAQKARKHRVSLSSRENEILEKRKKELEYGFAVQGLSQKIEVTDEEVDRYAPGWTAPLPERWEVLYIFVDTTVATTDSERIALGERARWIRKRLTPENFRDMAHLWSDAPSSTEGGYLGAIRLEGLGPTFVSHIRKTPVGTIGGPYKTKSGWNIFYIRSHTPSKERDIPREKLREMTAQVKADARVKQACDSTEDWNFLMYELGLTHDPRIQLETAAMENFFLYQIYLALLISAESPTEEQLRVIFQEKSYFHAPRRKAREIFLGSKEWSQKKTREVWIGRRAVRDRAREIRERILEGEDFAEAARKYSQSESASSGGDLGWIQEPSSYILDTTLSRLEIGEVSPPVPSEKGYHLLQLLEVGENRPMSFLEAREKCEKTWYGRKRAFLQKKLREEWGQTPKK